MSQPSSTIQELQDQIVAFSKERGWDRHHTPRSLAISISLEAAELLEHFQWDDVKGHTKEQMADEVADILTYLLAFAHETDIDIAAAYKAKLAKSAKKYPLTDFHKDADISDAFFRVKQESRKRKKGL